MVGDLPPSFCAGTELSAGIIAIAGSGSSVVHFFSDGSHYLYDGVGAGGRDLGFWLAQAYLRGSMQGKARNFIEHHAPGLRAHPQRSTADYYHDDELRHLPQYITPEVPAWPELKIWIDVVADRWRYKLYGIVNKFMQKEPDLPTVPVVLNGGLWEMDYIREAVDHSLNQDFGTSVSVLYDPEARPVVGALRMARDSCHTRH